MVQPMGKQRISQSERALHQDYVIKSNGIQSLRIKWSQVMLATIETLFKCC